jgi:RimJ/RimL family protein N-acetyltransferase
MKNLELCLFNFFERNDVLFLYDLRRNEKITPLLIGSPPKNIEQHESWLFKNTVENKNRLVFLIKIDEKNIGYCQAYNITNTHVEVGFVIHPDHQGRGIGTWTVKSLVEKLKTMGETAGKTVCLYVMRNNLPAVHVYEKLGFKRVNEDIEKSLIYLEL